MDISRFSKGLQGNRLQMGLSQEGQWAVQGKVSCQGYTPKEVINYNENFSPVVKHTSIRMLLAIVAQFDLELEQMDVKIAFLHDELEENIYMKQPESYIQEGKENKVCLLMKFLYGL